MKKIVLILFSFLSFVTLDGQDYYVSSAGKIDKVNALTCSKTTLCDYSKFIGFGGFQDIAITPNGNFYGVTITGLLYQLNLGNCTYQLVAQYPKFCSSLVSDNNGILYGGAANLMVYDPSANTMIDLGAFPNSWASAGDFSFSNGKMYMITTNQELIEIDKKDPSNSKLVFVLKKTYGAAFGLFTVPISCDSAVSYCGFNNGTVGILNFNTQSVDSICNMGYPITGASCPLEFAASDCALTIDLDLDNSSGVYPNDYLDKSSCIKINRPICDTSDIVVGSFNKLDSITIELINPIDGVDEYLTGKATKQIDIIKKSSFKLVLVNIGNAKPADFAKLIKTMSYNNNAQQPTAATRVISFQVFSKGNASKIASAYLQLIPGLSAGEDLTLFICENEPPVDLSNYITGAKGGNWVPGNGIFDAKAGKDIKYKYIVQSPDCGSDTAIIIVKLVKMPAYNLDSIIISCDSSPINLAVLNTTDYNVIWQDGTKGNEYLVQKSGLYWFKADNGYGCVLEDTSLVILTKEHKYLNDYLVPPNQTSFSLNNVSYTGDTLFCSPVGVKTYLGCDSNYCVRIRFSDVKTEKKVVICKGDSYLFKGKYISTTGTYIDTLKSVNNKDSLSILKLQVVDLPDVIISGPDYICVDQSITIQIVSSKQLSYLWQDGSTSSDYLVSKPLLYSVTVSDSNGCSSVSIKEVKPANPPDFSYNFKNIDCNIVDNGYIEIKDTIGGAHPILFELSLNGQVINDYQHLKIGNYLLKAIDANGCIKEKEIMLEALPLPLIDLGPDIYLQEGDSLWIIAGPLYKTTASYEWSPSDLLKEQIKNRAKFVVKESTTITVKLTDANGCVVTDDINILVKEKLKVYFPNSFSPDYDGINDKFTAYANAAKWQVKELLIYDRWGEQVYSQKDFPPSDPSYGWNGKYHDKYVNAGVYIYYAVVKSISGEEYEMKGDVNLVR